jgi:hypothetical protein
LCEFEFWKLFCVTGSVLLKDEQWKCTGFVTAGSEVLGIGNCPHADNELPRAVVQVAVLFVQNAREVV